MFLRSSPKSRQVLVSSGRHSAEPMTSSLAVKHMDGKVRGQGARNRSLRDLAFDFVVVNRSYPAPPVEAAAFSHQSKKSGPNPWPASKHANKGHSTRRWKCANAPTTNPRFSPRHTEKEVSATGCTTTKAVPREVKDLVSRCISSCTRLICAVFPAKKLSVLRSRCI